ncbi:hypothetical protein CSC94_12695 [Zhengella mangrovi]|uniref:DUF2190 domain-containing protein n=1 Tax=Zhengella mangrovi TaxID=1982044 RepID=A0A2G1QM18_9HYPH|nr:DUF2190 family protein [Zhengella mangrovi]PHP66542.1 hypothetical protein CSC94_12695 [Zhengella mangrovi]
MAVQTTYSDKMAAAFNGMIANEEPSVLISRTVETSGGVGFGIPVIQGSTDDGCDEVAASTDAVIGITCRDQSVNPAAADTFGEGASALLMRSGVIWVTVTDAGGVAAGDPVWVKVADGTFSNADVGTDGSLKLAGCRWESSAANGGLAKIRVNLDVPAVAGAS